MGMLTARCGSQYPEGLCRDKPVGHNLGMVPLHVQLANSTLRAVIKRLRLPLDIMLVCVKRWRLSQQTPGTLAELARQCNPTVRGWWNYYGAFYPTALRNLWSYMDHRLERWARRKYKTLQRHKRGSVEWLGKIKDAYPGMFEHWRMMGRVG